MSEPTVIALALFTTWPGGKTEVIGGLTLDAHLT